MSIVLVIIGLLVGGILVGQDLIRAAYVRAQISQIEKFNTAVNTFFGKYQALPGDMNSQTAQTFGFDLQVHNSSMDTAPGWGDGDGILGMHSTMTMNGGVVIDASVQYLFAETAVFWVDLSSTTAGNLIEGGFNTAYEWPSGSQYALDDFSGGMGGILNLFMPLAKIGGGNYVYITSINGRNYYGIENVSMLGFDYGQLGSAGMTVAQAYNIDKKVDDGLPTTGNVAAIVTNYAPAWVLGGAPGAQDTYVPSGSIFSGIAATAGNAAGPTTCFDAPTVGGATNYSMEINHGAGLNCALIFKMQGGD